MSQNVSGKSALYTQSGLSQAKFSDFQKDLYDISFTPAIWGIASLLEMRTNATVWAVEQGVPLNYVYSSSNWTYSQYLTHVVEGLRNERPVLMLTWNSPISAVDWHWITLTRIYNPGDGSGARVVASNWGWLQEYDFDLWVAESGPDKGTIYFE